MKKNRIIRGLCLLLSLLFVFQLAACTPDSGDPTDTTVESTATTGPDTEDATEEETLEPEFYPEINLPTDPAGVMALIDSVAEGSLETEWTIDLAYAAWAALSEEDRAKITNYDKLRDLLQQVADAHIVKDYLDDRMPHGEIIIGAYYHPDALTDEQMQDMVDAHLDFIHGAEPTVAAMDRLHEYGLGAVFLWPDLGYTADGRNDAYGYLTGGNEGWSNMRMLPNKSVNIVIQNTILNHPAVWMLDVDEESSNTFWYQGRDAQAFRNAYPHLQTISNMFPNEAGIGVGSYSYEKYIRDYIHFFGSDFVSVDHYMFNIYSPGLPAFLHGLSTMADSCKDSNRDLMMIMQINRVTDAPAAPSLEQIKFQAYGTLAFGGKCIDWAGYDAKCWYTEDALDERGNKTPQYYKMQECNADLKRLSPVYMRYTASNQTMLNADAQGSELDYFIAKNPLEAMGHKTITNLAVAEKKDVLVGFYEKNLGEGEAFLFVNADKNCVMNNAPTTTTVSFKTVSPASVVTAYVKGVPTILTPVDGVYTIQVVDADAVFVTVSEPASLNPKPVFPVGQITIGGTDISEFTIVIPAKATVRERQAAEAIADVIAKATGKTLPITTDAATPAHAISLGKTTLASAASGLSLASLKGDGYALMMDGTHLYISGNDAPGAGTLFGVYGFCEDYLGVGFYADDYVTIPTAQSITVDEGINEVHNPAFLLREASNYVAADQTYPLYQKYNGMSVYGDTNFGADMTGGGSMIALTGCLYETDRACLTNEMTYTAILRNAKRVLACDPDTEYLTCDLPLNPEDSDVTIPCTCENCTAIIDSEGIMGLALTIVNRLANDLRADYPDLLISTLAMGKSLQIPTTIRPAENVMIRVAMPISACRFHGLGDESCEVNASFRNTLKEWTEICDTVFLLDQATERSTNHIYTHPVDHNGNPLALFDTMQYLRELGIAGYQQTGYDTPSADMEAMHNYLLSRLLWDEDITREEYEQEMDGFLKAYYGAGWSYIRQYIDMVYKTDGVTHQEGSTDMAIIFRLNDQAFAKECFRLWNAAIDAAETAIFRRNTEIDSLQMYAVAKESRILLQVRYFERLLNRYNFVVS